MITDWTIDDPAREAKVRQLYAVLKPGDDVDVTHHMKIGFNQYECHTTGVVMSTERRECGTDGGWRRNWDDRYWFDHLVLRRDDGELTTVTIDEYTEITNIATASVEHQHTTELGSIRSPGNEGGGALMPGTWKTSQFASGAVGIGSLILVAFSLPLAIVAAAVGQAWVLWVVVPHLVLASMILGGIVSGLFLMDSPDDRPAAAVPLPRSASTCGRGTRPSFDPSCGPTRRAA
jgi:hypothetical protein